MTGEGTSDWLDAAASTQIVRSAGGVMKGQADLDGFPLVAPPIDRRSEMPFTLTIAQRGDPFWAIAQRFQYEHYLALGYIEPSANNVVPGYERWDETAAFHVVHEGDEVIGTIRTLPGVLSDLPTGHHWELDKSLLPGPVIEIASFVVVPGMRGLGASEVLMGSAFRWVLERRGSSVLAMVDPWLLDVLRDAYGLPFKELGPAIPYMGGLPLPVGALMSEVCDAVPAHNPRFWKVITGHAQVPSIPVETDPVTL